MSSLKQIMFRLSQEQTDVVALVAHKSGFEPTNIIHAILDDALQIKEKSMIRDIIKMSIEHKDTPAMKLDSRMSKLKRQEGKDD